MLEPGIKLTLTEKVTYEKTAVSIESGALKVYATPCMVALMEKTAFRSVADRLEPGKGTVGTKLDIEHLAPTCEGMVVVCTSELIEIDRRRLVFKVEVRDAAGLIGKGVHERFIIDEEKFEKKASEKLAAYSQDVTTKGNPAKPEGEEGAEMLKHMNDSHAEVTGWMLKLADIKPEEKVLDIGCGGGMTLYRIAEEVPEAELVGLDYSEVSIKETDELNKKSIEEGRLKTVQASVDDMPFDDGDFDKIISVESLYFWKDLSKSIREIKRVLKPGGKALICIDIYENENLPQDARDNIKKYDMYVPTPDEAKEVFAREGFNAVKVHTTDNGKYWMCVEAEK